MLFGDSFAGQYEPFWDIVGTQLKINIQSITTNWCYPSISDGFTGRVTSKAYEQCKFNRRYFENSLKDFDFVIFGGQWADVIKKQKFNEVLEIINIAAADEEKLVIIMPSPELFIKRSLKNYIYRPSIENTLVNSVKEQHAAIANKRLSDEANNFENVFFLERHSIFRNSGLPSALTNDNLPYPSDGSHISIYGAKKAAETFLQTDTFERINMFMN